MSPLERLQLDIAARLTADPYFADVGIYILRPRRKADGTEESLPDIQSKIESALNGLVETGGGKGAAVTVLMPLLDVPDPDASGPHTQLVVTIRCQELPMVNMGEGGTKKSAEDLAINALVLLHGVNILGYTAPRNGQLLRAHKDALSPSMEFEPAITYDAKVQIELRLQPRQLTDRPRITVDAGTAQLTCSTPAASIYYTLDGSYPRPSTDFELSLETNPNTAQLYAEPVALAPGQTLRAVAYAADRTASHLALFQSPAS